LTGRGRAGELAQRAETGLGIACPISIGPATIHRVNSASDQQLLREYRECQSESAFGELVRRHVDLVYSVARRILHDASLAEDATQSVFLALAQNASKLADRPVLTGWLHRTARNIAAATIRSDVRRRAREQQTAVMKEILGDEPGAIWEQIAPHLDAAVAQLNDADRDALLLRFFHRKSANQIAEILGISAEASQKRISRALGRLRVLLTRHGVGATSGALALAISNHAVQAAPAGLSAAISAAAVLSNSAAAAMTAATATQGAFMTILQKSLVATAIVAAVGTGMYEAHRASVLQGRVQEFGQQQTQFAGRIADLESDLSAATAQLNAARDESEQLRQNTGELLRLRGEVTRLRADLRQSAQPDAGSSGVTEVALKSWLERAKEFKRLPERMPDKSIPELQLLTEEDWLELAKEPLGHSAEQVNLADEATARLILSSVRAKAKDKLMRVFSRALEGFAKANQGQLPTDPLQLKPYLMNSEFLGPARAIEIPDNAVDDTILGRYEILQRGKLGDVPNDSTILAEKAPVDGQYDTRLKLGKSWMAVGGLDEYSPGKGLTIE